MRRIAQDHRTAAVHRVSVVMAGALLTVGLLGGAAQAMQPPGGPAQRNFGCPNPVAGHPGAAGLVDATPKVAALTGNPMPTAWNAVVRADPIELGEC